MIEKTFSAATQFSGPVLLRQGRTMAISISGTFVGTVQIQKIIPEDGDNSYPLHSDARWNVVQSYTAPVEEQVQQGDNCWYRAYCSAYTSGSPVAKLKV